MNRQRLLNRILELFRIFHFEVAAHNKAGHFDINRIAEDVLISVFKDTFDCHFLRNLNKEKQNYPGLDLGDDYARTAFQITSDPSIEKIKETLTKVVAHKHYDRYDTIYIYLLSEKQKKYNRKVLQGITNGYFEFDPNTHIIDSKDIAAKINELDYDLIQRIEQTLEVHFSNPAKYFLRPQVAKKSEELTLNMMPISFPDEVFISKVIYDREEVIKKSWERDFKLSYRASERSVVRAALEQQGLKFSSAWVVRSGEIVTFHNLRDENLPLSVLVDPAAADPIPVNTYIHNDDGELDIDRLNIFKELLRATFQAQLHHRGITWQHEERLFIFTDPEHREVRKEAWSQGKKEGRIVYQKVRREDDPEKTRFHEHLAFETGFDLYDGQWYLAIKPDFFCSYNGYNKSEYHHKKRVSFLKRNAWNEDVIEDLLYITEILRKDQDAELLKQEMLGVRITLGDLVTLGGAEPINDAEWLREDEKKKRKALNKASKSDAKKRRKSRKKPLESETQALLFESHETGNNP